MTKYILAAGLLTASLAGCSPPHPRVGPKAPLRQISSLTCPGDEGELKLQAGSVGPQSCVYATDDGDRVTLQLVDLGGAGVETALQPIEAQLAAEVPSAVKTSGHPDSPAPPAAGGDKDRVDVDLPGLHIHTRGDGQADIDTAGVHVTADDQGAGDAKARVSVDGGHRAGVRVDAHDGGAEIRLSEPGPGVRLDYVLQSDTAGPNGYRLAAYEARGPAGGPIVVAKILGRESDGDALRHDVRRLIAQNVGG